MTRILPLFLPAMLMAQFTPEQLQEDLRIARQALQEGHEGVYRFTAKADFERGFAQAAARLTRPMTAVEFYRVLAPAVALVKCGHTIVNLPLEVQKQLQASLLLLPFDVDILSGRVYILRDFTPAAARAGAEILSINGIPASKLLAQLEAATPGDGNIAVGRWGRLARGGFVRQLSIVAGLESPYRVTYRPQGTVKAETKEFAGIAPGQRPVAPAPGADKPLAYLEFPAPKVAVLTIRTFGGFADRARKVPLGPFLAEAFGEIQAKGAETLILDLRGNSGGRDALGKQLFAHLTDHDFIYYQALILNKRSFSFAPYLDRPVEIAGGDVQARPDGRFDVAHPNIGPQQPAQPGFRGRVIALADRDSFSATGEFLTAFHSARRGAIVGEETGAGYTGNTSGDSANLTLPHTKLRLGVPLNGYYLPSVRPAARDRGVPPDVPVALTIAGKLTGRDPVMERALRLASEKK